MSKYYDFVNFQHTETFFFISYACRQCANSSCEAILCSQALKGDIKIVNKINKKTTLDSAKTNFYSFDPYVCNGWRVDIYNMIDSLNGKKLSGSLNKDSLNCVKCKQNKQLRKYFRYILQKVSD